MGSLYGDLHELAALLQRECVDAMVVWANDVGYVHLSPLSESTAIPTAWVVGTFRIGGTVADVVENLEAKRRDRRASRE